MSEEEGEEEAIEANERCDSMSTALSELQGDPHPKQMRGELSHSSGPLWKR